MSIENMLNSLNASQLEAVTAPLGAVRILAGAGSGKTRVLVARIAWLIETGQCAPWSILAVTFTNKAALEMKIRVEKQVHVPLHGMWIGTFHSLCHRFLRLHYKEAGLIQTFQVMDSDDQIRLCRRIIRAEGLDEKQYVPKVLAQFINHHKDEGRRAEHIDIGHDPISIKLVELYKIYEKICNQTGLVDFSEILLRTLETLRTNITLLAHYQDRFQFILVDEFQDTNSVQYAWLKILAQTHQRIFVVGDDDQSIYGWRGARIENILTFDRDFKDTTTVFLEQNYRSTPAILEAANAVIAKNTDRLEKKLWTEDDNQDLVTAYYAIDAYDEARFVVEQIEMSLRKGDLARNEIAILYRSNAQSRVFEELLLRNKIPYRVYGGLRFFDRSEVKDLLSYLRLMINVHDDVSLERAIVTPPKGIGNVTIEKIREYAAHHLTSLWDGMHFLLESQTLSSRAQNALLSFGALINTLQDEIQQRSLDEFIELTIEKSALKAHYKKEPMGRGEERIENLEELISAAKYFISDYGRNQLFVDATEDIQALSSHEQLIRFLNQTTLDSTDHQADVGTESIQLMTLHSSKGLEFKNVYLVGMEEGVFPSEASSYDRVRLEEERRLAYVGITRARKRLCLTTSESRIIHGKLARLAPSRFLKDIPEHLLQIIGPSIQIRQPVMGNVILRKTGMPTISQEMSGFKLGQTIVHDKFGEGVIIEFEGSGPHARVTIQFAAVGKKILVLSYAKLKPLSS